MAAPESAVEPTGYVDWKRWDAAAFGRFSKAEARYFGWHLQRCGVGGSAQVLEIGFGNGAFLGYARQRGLGVAGIEIEPTLRARAQALGVPAAADLQGLADGLPTFDLIVAFDVFEHLSRDALAGWLQQACVRLSPQGVLLCRVPNGDSPFGRKHQHGDVTHVSVWSLDALVLTAASAGLRLRYQREAPWHSMPDRRRNLGSLSRACVQAVLEAAVRYAYRWKDLQLAPNLVAAFEREPGPRSGTADNPVAVAARLAVSTNGPAPG